MPGIVGDPQFGLRGGETVVSGSYSAVRDLEDGDAVRVPSEEEKGKTERRRG